MAELNGKKILFSPHVHIEGGGGGGGELYRHGLFVTAINGQVWLTCVIINTSATAMTINDLLAFLRNNGYDAVNKPFSVSGFNKSNQSFLIGICATSNSLYSTPSMKTDGTNADFVNLTTPQIAIDIVSQIM